MKIMDDPKGLTPQELVAWARKHGLQTEEVSSNLWRVTFKGHYVSVTPQKSLLEEATYTAASLLHALSQMNYQPMLYDSRFSIEADVDGATLMFHDTPVCRCTTAEGCEKVKEAITNYEKVILDCYGVGIKSLLVGEGAAVANDEVEWRR